MKTFSFILVLVCGLVLNIQAQSNKKETSDGPNIKGSVDWLNKNIGQVNSGAWTYIQKFEYNPAEPCKVTYSRIESKEGATTTYRWEFSLKDIDQYSAMYDVSGTRVEVFLFSKNKARVLQWFRNDQVYKYDNEVMLFAVDVEAARKIVDAFKHTAELCNNAGGSEWYKDK